MDYSKPKNDNILPELTCTICLPVPNSGFTVSKPLGRNTSKPQFCLTVESIKQIFSKGLSKTKNPTHHKSNQNRGQKTAVNKKVKKKMQKRNLLRKKRNSFFSNSTTEKDFLKNSKIKVLEKETCKNFMMMFKNLKKVRALKSQRMKPADRFDVIGKLAARSCEIDEAVHDGFDSVMGVFTAIEARVEYSFREGNEMEDDDIDFLEIFDSEGG